MIWVGTSGWQYASWRDRFYPRGLATRDWLSFYASRFQTVEVNNTFYRLPRRETFADWAARTPDDFRFVLKMSRFLTHVKRLQDPEEPVARFLDAARGLATKLGPILLQFSARHVADPERLRRALLAYPPGMRLAVEARHESWHTDEIRRILEERNAALCLADRGSRPVTPLWRTADWGYLRFHAGAASPPACYGRGALRAWAERLAELYEPSEDVYVFFNNDPSACAVRDAAVFAREMARLGRPATRTPLPREVRVA